MLHRKNAVARSQLLVIRKKNETKTVFLNQNGPQDAEKES
jgi:hypothetical protein